MLTGLNRYISTKWSPGVFAHCCDWLAVCVVPVADVAIEWTERGLTMRNFDGVKSLMWSRLE